MTDTNGFRSPSGQPLESYRPYLKWLVRLQRPILPVSVDASDIVQDVFVKAHKKRETFRGEAEREWLAWLRTILVRTITDWTKDPANEPMIRDGIEKSDYKLINILASTHTLPPERVEREEQLIQLANALERLLEVEQTAVELRFLRDPPLSVAEIGVHLGRSRNAAAKGLGRAMEKLREDFLR